MAEWLLSMACQQPTTMLRDNYATCYTKWLHACIKSFRLFHFTHWCTDTLGWIWNLLKTLCICIWDFGEGNVSWYVLRTYGCHRNGWRWCRGRCSAGPADLSSRASCCGSTASSSHLCAQQRQWIPGQPRTQVRIGMFRARILDPAGAPRSVIRAAPLWQLSSDHIPQRKAHIPALHGVIKRAKIRVLVSVNQVLGDEMNLCVTAALETGAPTASDCAVWTPLCHHDPFSTSILLAFSSCYNQQMSRHVMSRVWWGG